MSKKAPTARQIALLHTLAAKAAAELGEDKEAYLRNTLLKVAGKTHISELTQLEFDECGAEMAGDAGEYILAQKMLTQARVRLTWRAMMFAQAVAGGNAEAYATGIARQAKLLPEGMKSFAEMPVLQLRALVKMLAVHQHRCKGRCRPLQNARKGRDGEINV